MQAIAEQSRIVRLPLNRVGTIQKVNKVFSDLEQKFQREPSSEELAEVLNISSAEVQESFRISGRHISMDAPFATGQESNLLDVLPNNDQARPDAGLMYDSLRKEIQRSLSTLTQRESEVIAYYFGLNDQKALTLEEIGYKFDLTRERVRQIKEKATRRLKHSSRSNTLKNFLN
jgi:RNA polymerase primary sigma factor